MTRPFRFLALTINLLVATSLRAPLGLSAASSLVRHPPARAFAAWASELAAHGGRVPNASFLRAGASLRAARTAAMRAALRGGRLAEVLEWGRSLTGMARASLEAAGAAPDEEWVNAMANLSTAMGVPTVWERGARAIVQQAAQLPGREGAWLDVRVAGGRSRHDGGVHSPLERAHDMLSGKDVPVQGLVLDNVFVLDAAASADCQEEAAGASVRCLIGGTQKLAPSLSEAEAEAQREISGGRIRLAAAAKLSLPHGRLLPALDAGVYSTGSRSLLFVSSLYSDVPFPSPATGVEPSMTNLQQLCSRVSSNLTRSALGAASFSCRVHTSTLTLSASCASQPSLQLLSNLARAQLAAAGVDVSLSSTHVVLAFPFCSQLSYSGVGFMPGASVAMNCQSYLSDSCVGTVVHEVGHNMGLHHAAVRYVGTNGLEEYGDIYDTMGRSSNLGDFSAGYKAAMTWIPPRAVLTLSSSEAPSSLPAASLLYAFRAADGSQPSVAFSLSALDRGAPIPTNAVLSFRVVAPESPEWMYGTLRSLQPAASGKLSLNEVPMESSGFFGFVGMSRLLDTAPVTLSADDGPLGPGRAWIYRPSGGGRLLIENWGPVLPSATDSPMFVRTSYLTPDWRRPEGEGCLADGRCQRSWASAVASLSCGNTSLLSLDPLTASMGVFALPSFSTPTLVTLSTCSGAGNSTPTQLGVFATPPIAEFLSLSSLTANADVAVGFKAFDAASGARGACVTATFVVQPVSPTAPLFVAAADEARGGTRNISLGMTCASASSTAGGPPDRSGFTFISSGFWGSGDACTAHTALVNGRVQWRCDSFWVQMAPYGAWVIVDVNSPSTQNAVYAFSDSSPPSVFTSVTSMTFWSSSGWTAASVSFTFTCQPTAWYNAISGLCIPCMPGGLAIPGASSAAQCVCDAGATLSVYGQCVPCAAGTYKARRGSESTAGGCVACPGGSSSAPGASICTIDAVRTPPVLCDGPGWAPLPSGICACPWGMVLFPTRECVPPYNVSIAGTGALSSGAVFTSAAAPGTSVIAWRRTVGGQQQWLWLDSDRSEWSISAMAPSSASPRFAFLPLGSVSISIAASALGVGAAYAGAPFSPDPTLAARAGGTAPSWALRSTVGILPAGAQPWRIFTGAAVGPAPAAAWLPSISVATLTVLAAPPVPSVSPTVSPTPISWTPSPTRSRTRTPTQSASWTETSSSSASSSMSASPSSSNSATETASFTSTRSSMATRSSTRSGTAAETQSRTSTAAATQSRTRSAATTQSRTGTGSPSSSPSVSDTLSPSSSVSVSAVATPPPSNTASVSVSTSASPPETSSKSRSFTPSASAYVTRSRSSSRRSKSQTASRSRASRSKSLSRSKKKKAA